MQVVRITKTYGRTVNVGDFNNIRFDNTLEAALEPGEDVQEAGATLYNLAKEATEEDVLAKLNEIQGSRDDIFNHVAALNNKYKRA